MACLYFGSVYPAGEKEKEIFDMNKRFEGIEKFSSRVWLSSPTMHGIEQKWVDEAIQTNWVSTVGANINEVEKEMAQVIGAGYTVALSSGTAALHLAVKLAGEKLYGKPHTGHGTLEGKKVFCSDMTFAATVNPVVYEGGEPVFIDSEIDTWNMDPQALSQAFSRYPDVKLIVVAHLYGTPGKIDEIRQIADAHGALIVEDAAESLGATYKKVKTGTFGDVGVISFNGNKIITGSSGGMLLAKTRQEADKARKWSTQSRESAPWYQHEEIGYNYRMSNLIAGVVRGQIPFLFHHIEQKRAIYERYKEKLADLPIQMNPYDRINSVPNFWLSCLTIDEEAMAPQVRGDQDYLYKYEHGKSSPQEILDTLACFNAEGRPIWKPMHMQPCYRPNGFVTASDGVNTADSTCGTGADIFRRGLCLPSDNKMTEEQQDRIIEIIKRCFA